jgi:hypothetical protein
VQNDRAVWIVGEPEEHLPKTDPRYHTGDCYVLDQGPNRDRVKKVQLSGLPEVYGPCQICAPGGRTSGGSAGTMGWQTPTPLEPPTGAQPGYIVHIEDLATGRLSTVRLSARRQRQAGEISPQAPLGKALLGKDIGTVVEFDAPGRGQRKVLIVDFELSLTGTTRPRQRTDAQSRDRLSPRAGPAQRRAKSPDWTGRVSP